MHSNYLAAQRAYGANQAFSTQKAANIPFAAGAESTSMRFFAEAMLASLNKQGRLGCILPSGIATDNTTRHFSAPLVESGRLLSLHDFREQGKNLSRH